MFGTNKNGLKFKRAAAFVAAVIAFLFSQALIVSHTAKYGEGPHDHGGQVCVLSLAAPVDQKVLGTAGFALVMVFAVWRITTVAAQQARVPVRVSAKRSRAPPQR